ncbi:MAG: PKD domain-containing protein, partial [Bacteroidota bacterium]|nr:PKD domain-containing protein [Bacteroidota bacterium]
SWDSANIVNSKKIVNDNGPGNYFSWGIQIGIDRKIYVTNTYYIDCIEFPNNVDTFCGYKDSAIYLLGNQSLLNFPDFLQSYFFKPDFEAIGTCFSDTTQFYLQDSSQVDSLFWIFDDSISGANNYSTSWAPQHYFSDTGIYNVNMIVYHDTFADTSERKIRISPYPSANFSINDNAQCLASNYFVFSNSTSISSGLCSYEWHFGDSIKSYDTNTNHVYSYEDSFNVKMYALSDYGCEDSVSKTVYVFPPKADFEITDSAQCSLGNNFEFINKTSNNFGTIQYSWLFGDGDTSNVADTVYHSYQTSDTFSVTLIATSNFGCSDTLTKQLVVNQKPNIIAQSYNDTFCVEDSISTYVSAIGTQPFIYQWNKNGQFLLGETDSLLNFLSTSRNDSGIYQCVVSNFCGVDSANNIKLTVYDGPTINLIPDKSTIIVETYILWQKCFGGSSNDIGYNLIQTNDGNYLFVGNTKSNNYDVSGNHGSQDYWVCKLSDDKNILWQKCYGGTNYDKGFDIHELSNNKYFISGFSASTNGDVSGNNGSSDFWNVMIDDVGAINNQNCIGGSSSEKAICSGKINEYSFVVGGATNSTSGNYSTNHGGSDILIIKTDRSGNIAWQKCIGGSKNDNCYGIAVEGKYIYAVGSSNSSDGNITKSYGNMDIIVTKLDTNGNLIWAKNYGGDLNDEGFDICIVNGGITFTGYTSSNKYFIKKPKGQVDVFIIKIDQGGNILWKNRYGGRNVEIGFSINKTMDNGILVSGYSNSKDKDIKDNNGFDDSWVFKVDKNGKLIWEKNLGGTSGETSYEAIQLNINEYLVLSNTSSFNIDVSGNHGNLDVWLVKLKEKYKVEICEHDSLILTVKASGVKPIFYQWFKDDNPINGATSTKLIIPNTVLSDSGNYYCIASNMCIPDTLDKVHVTIHTVPIANFIINDSTQCLNTNKFDFTNLTTFGNSSDLNYHWNFGNGSSSTDSNGHKKYSTFDTFDVQLISTSSYGCADTTVKKVYVFESPKADFSVNDSSQCFNENSFQFTNLTAFQNLLGLNYSWDFGNDSSSTDSNGQMTYLDFDTFSVQLVSTSNLGCADTVTKSIFVNPNPKTDFSVNNSVQCLNENSFEFFNLTAFQNLLGLNYNWDFGNGSTSTDSNEQLKYSSFDTFDVKLVATSTIGCKDSITKSVIVNPS